MIVYACNPGHDGAVALIEDRQLVVSLESEKDSFSRHSLVSPMSLLSAIDLLERVPDVIALSGWWKHNWLGQRDVGAGYPGAHRVLESSIRLAGQDVTVFSSTHIRSHIMMAVGMAPPDDARLRAVLVWEGLEGSFYLLDENLQILREIPVMTVPGGRYAFLFAIADPTFPDEERIPRLDDSGKLMALAAYGDPADVDPDVAATVDQVLSPDPLVFPAKKSAFSKSPLYNAGVTAQQTKDAAALLSNRIFESFAKVAIEALPKGLPLHISGGCGLNCDWNTGWRELGHFASVFVPPCTNDSGSALGTGLDALASMTGDPRISWDVYRGLEFEWDRLPQHWLWSRRSVEMADVAEALAQGRVFAWVQGRWEMGPRALGNRSLLADARNPATRDRLNEIKQRESYRPIAPCCRLEDVGKVFDRDFADPHMLYFRRVTTDKLAAITHVDQSARVQTVTRESNTALHELLSAVAERQGVGVLCNTSLNFKALGFINRMSDLIAYCNATGIDDFVVGDSWFQRTHHLAVPIAREQARLEI